jgi:hypothetical protein
MNSINAEVLYNTQKHEEFVNNLKANLQKDLENKSILQHELSKM